MYSHSFGRSIFATQSRHHPNCQSLDPPLRIAIVSDIHANQTAFDAVLAHAKSIGYDMMVCLGDVIGYGPDPVECIDLVQQHCEWALLGNHDFAVLYEPTNFNRAAREAVFWTRGETIDGRWLARQIEAARTKSKDGGADAAARIAQLEIEQRARVDFMFRISPRKILLDRYICVHASPSKPVNEYLFGDDVNENGSKLPRNFRLLTLPDGKGGDHPACALVGHTHCPGFILEELPDAVEDALRAPAAAMPEREGVSDSVAAILREMNERESASRTTRDRYDWLPFRAGMSEWTPGPDEMQPGCRFILNPGSVGQPRDGDPRACYVMLEVGENGAADRFTFHRVEYEIVKTQERILDLIEAGEKLQPWLAERLATGQ